MGVTKEEGLKAFKRLLADNAKDKVFIKAMEAAMTEAMTTFAPETDSAYQVRPRCELDFPHFIGPRGVCVTCRKVFK